jgi:outer membrane receptor for ferrienterochelin and colicins
MNLKIIILIVISFYTTLSFAQTASIQVLDETKQPVPNAHIKIKETQKLIVSDVNGIATIPFENQTQLTLEISFLGFAKKTQIIKPNNNLKVELAEDAVSLNSFVVTGQYADNNPEKAVQKITIIDKEKIEKMAAVNLTDVLENETNIRLSQDGILGSSMSIQGLSGENVKILVDGVAVIGRLDGGIDISQLNLNEIERIEIVEGPMSVNYGTNALAGVVNIITKKPASNKLNLKANSYYENIGTYNFDGTISNTFGKHSYSITGGRNYFDGWKDNDPLFKENEPIADSTRFKTWKPKEQYFGRFKYQYTTKNTTVAYTLNAFDEKITNRGLPRAPYSETAFDDYYKTLRLDNSIQIKTKLKKQKNISFLAAYNYFKRTKNTYFKDLTTLDEVITTNPSDQDTSGFDLITVRTSFSNANDSIKVNYQIGVDLNKETAEGARIESQTQQIGDYAAFASIEYKPFKNTIIRPGVRYSYNTEYESPLTPSLNIKQSIIKVNIRASYARGFRAPSLKELYFNFVDINHNIIGNNGLTAETSNNFNLAANYTKLIKSYLLKIEVSTFYNQIDNLISLAQIQGTEYSYVNIGNFSTNGVQFNTNISYNHFKFGVATTLVGRENFLSQTNSNVDKYSYSPELKLNANYDIVKWNSFIAVFYKFNGKLSSFAIDANNDVYQTYIEAYQIADVTIGKKFWKNKIAFSLGSKNVFNVKNVNSVATGGAHSSNSGSNLVATGRTYFAKLSINLTYDKK